MTLSRTANRERRELFRQGRTFPPTFDRYRLTRATDVSMPASLALWLTRQDRAAEAAGIPPWADYLTDEPVMVDGREYRVTVEQDIDAYPPSQMGDCYGEVREPTATDIERNWGNPPPVEWPEVRPAGQTWSYHPGDTFDPDWRPRGMARGPAREHVRELLAVEGWRYRQNETGERPMFHVVTVRDVAEDNYTTVGGVDGLDSETSGRAYLWWAVQDLAAETGRRGAPEAPGRPKPALCGYRPRLGRFTLAPAVACDSESATVSPSITPTNRRTNP